MPRDQKSVETQPAIFAESGPNPAAPRLDGSGAVFVLDREGTIIDTSETMSGLTGFSFEELIGTRLELLLDGEGGRRLRGWFEGDHADEGSFRGVVRGRDEELRVVNLSVVPLAAEEEDRAGAVVRMIGYEPPDLIPGPERETMRLVDRITDPVLVVDGRASIIHRNPAARRLLGPGGGEEDGRLLPGFPARDGDRLRAALKQARAGRSTELLDTSIQSLREGPVAVDLWLTPGPAGTEVVTLLILARDKTSDGREQELLDRLAELTGDGVALLGGDGRITVCDGDLARRFGFDHPEQLRGRNISDLVISNLLAAMTTGRGERFTRDAVVSVDTFGVTRAGALAPIRLDILAVAGGSEEGDQFICRVRASEQPVQPGGSTVRNASQGEAHES